MHSSTVDELATAAAWSWQRVDVAPYALVRLSALPYLAASGAAPRFRLLNRRLVDCERELGAISVPLGQQLYDSRANHTHDFHRRVVVPLRRDVHNGRYPATRLRQAIDELAVRLPLLGRWLTLIGERQRLQVELAASTEDALAADRAAMAEVCAAEPVRRAVALSSGALLAGVDKAAAAGAYPDARARKAEPKILRYALRATTKTSPWSWFTAVGWGEFEADGDELDQAAAQPVSVPNHALITPLVRALLAIPEIRDRTPHRVAQALAIGPHHVDFQRDEFFVVLRDVATAEQRVRLPRTGSLDFVLAQLRTGARTLDELAEALARCLPSDASGRAGAYVRRLADERLLVPVAPVDPQAIDPLPALADWLATHGRPELSAALGEIGSATRRFGGLAAGERPAALARLDDHWTAVFLRAGGEKPDTPAVKEDVVVPGKVRLGSAAGRDLRDDLAAVAPLTELFDNAAILRGLIRNRLVERYGPGGRCRVADLVDDGARLWAAASAITPDGIVTPPPADYPALPRELLDLAALRREIIGAARSVEPRDGEVELPDHLVAEAAAVLPAWLLPRPSSHAYFVQPYRCGAGVGWVVNGAVDGWGRYLSRFLGALGPEAAQAVAERLRTVFQGRRVAQYRPLVGFNANLHPRLVPDEVGEDPAWATLLADELELVHDARSDAVRLCVAATGEPLDVLYLGFLLQTILPGRAAPLYTDLGTGRSLLPALAPAAPIDFGGAHVWRRQRLRYHGLVLARRAWTLDQETVTRLRTELDRDGQVPIAATARWSAGLGLPDATFFAAAAADPFRAPTELLAYLADPKPQFVDLGSALHLRCLAKLLARHRGAVRIEEALPVPGESPTGRRAIELIVETYRTRRTP